MVHKKAMLNKIKLIPSLISRCFSKYGIHLSRNNKEMMETRGRHEGKRCFIIGNGPSLKNSDLVMLRDEITFASNKIFLVFDSIDWRPTYYSAEDILFIRNNYEDIVKLKGFTKFYPHFFKKYYSEFNDALYFYAAPYKNYPQLPNFSYDILDKVCGANTITYRLIQIAAYMGIKEIYLLGVDFDYKTYGSAVDKIGGCRVYKSEGELNHFHPDYIKKGERWMEPNLERHEKAYLSADKAFKKIGGKIYNATRGGKLEVFPRVDFDTLF